MKNLPALTAGALALLLPPAFAAEPGGGKANANLDLARQLNQAFVQVAEEVSPSVVVITVVQKSTPIHLGTVDGADDGRDPLEQFPPEFRRFLRQPPPEPTTGQGSGVVIRKDGYILTNRHVVEDAEKIEVRLKDGRRFKATVRGVDAPSDVAVIKIDADNLPAAKLADSAHTRVGEFAIAIGAPFALDYSVTFGHVSAKDRSNIMTDDGENPALMDQSFIQTDANINPGNSGGPLINIDGEVIGINTLIRGLHTGIGFAIPSNLAREVADALIETGKYPRSWLGVRIVSLADYESFRSLVTGVQDGVVVTEVVMNGPAAKSELHAGDVITAVDGKSVVTAPQLKDEVRVKKPGQDVTLSVFRQNADEGKAMKIVVKPAEWTEPGLTPPEIAATPPAEEDTSGTFGLKVDNVRRRNRGVEGVVVTHVDPHSVAARNGISEGDIITAVGGQKVTNPKEFSDAAKKTDLRKGVIISFNSHGSARIEVLKDKGQ